MLLSKKARLEIDKRDKKIQLLEETLADMREISTDINLQFVYVRFDLEATQRELEYVKKLLENGG